MKTNILNLEAKAKMTPFLFRDQKEIHDFNQTLQISLRFSLWEALRVLLGPVLLGPVPQQGDPVMKSCSVFIRSR